MMEEGEERIRAMYGKNYNGWQRSRTGTIREPFPRESKYQAEVKENSGFVSL
jgi:hypothetical protein